jgi:hypothetical protein
MNSTYHGVPVSKLQNPTFQDGSPPNWDHVRYDAMCVDNATAWQGMGVPKGGVDIILLRRAPARGVTAYRSASSMEVSVFSGLDLQNGDYMAVSARCGDGNAVPGIPGNVVPTRSLPATQAGKLFRWESKAGEVIETVPGLYRLCWCGSVPEDSELGPCDDLSKFAMDVGFVTIFGPELNQQYQCVSGRPCAIQKIRGLGLSAWDGIVLWMD